MDKQINVTRATLPSLEEFINEIKPIWENSYLTNMGVKHRQLEEQLKKYLQVQEISLFTNGHLALEAIIEAFGLRGEVITTPFTFASTTHAIVRKGLQPVFCDINDKDYTIDAEQIENLITSRTSAIIPVHVYGNVCDIEKIEYIAQKYNLKVIYDAAHAFGVEKNGINVANFGDASIFSFHATKVFNTIEGGAVTYKDSIFQCKLNNIKNFGIIGMESVEYIGGNAKMNEFQAAMGICNLRHLNEQIDKRKKIVERYKENLGYIEEIKFAEPQENVKSNYSYLAVLFNNYKKSRDEIFEELKENNIIARKYFYPLTNDFKCYSGKFNSNETPIAQWVSNNILTLPLYAELKLSTVDKICEIILKNK